MCNPYLFLADSYSRYAIALWFVGCGYYKLRYLVSINVKHILTTREATHITDTVAITLTERDGDGTRERNLPFRSQSVL